MGFVLLIGGFAGSWVGVQVFAWMTLGQIDLFVQLSYVLFLGLIGGMMFVGSLGALLRSRRLARRRRCAGRMCTPGCMK